MKCDCFFCQTDRDHPTTHIEFESVSSHLRVAESLNPEHSVAIEACISCGHKRPVAVSEE